MKDGDIGKAPTDPVKRRNIKYMERAELKARNYFKKDSRYDISISFNENIIFNEKIYVSKCGAPHIKFGI